MIDQNERYDQKNMSLLLHLRENDPHVIVRPHGLNLFVGSWYLFNISFIKTLDFTLGPRSTSLLPV